MAALFSRFISILFVADVAVIVAHFTFGKQSWLFDLDQEGNIPTYLAALQVLFVGLVMLEVFVRERRALDIQIPGKWIWGLLAVAFIYLAVDDVFAIHESVLRQEVRDLLPADSLWISLMPWQIIFAPLLGMIAICLVCVILSRFHSNRGLLKIAATGLACWIFAIILEALSKPVFMTLDAYHLGVAIEEGLELLGATLFLWAFTNYALLLQVSPLPLSITRPYVGVLPRAVGIILCVSFAGILGVVLVSISNTAWLYRHNGGVLAQNGQFERAIVAFNKSLDDEPENLKTLHALAATYMHAGDFEKALTTCEQSLQLEPKQVSIWLLQAAALKQMGRNESAEQSLERASQLEPRNAKIWSQLGKSQQQQKKLREAIQSYQTSLRINPDQSSLFEITESLQKELDANDTQQSTSHDTNVVAHIDNPFEDGWDTEAFTKLADKQIKSFGKLLKKESSLTPTNLEDLITPDFACDALLPKNQKEVFSGEALTVSRGGSETDSTAFRGAKGLSVAAKELVQIFQPAENIRSKFKIFRVHKSPDGRSFDTKLYVALMGRNGNAMVEQNATWAIRWQIGKEDTPPRMDSIRVEDFEVVRTTGENGALFAECTPAVLGANDCYEPQLLRGFNHWLETSQRRRHLFRLGTPGIAISDVDGDGREDLYLCQEVGLPNRLFLHQKDNRLVDVSKDWGVDWLHDSRCALFFDWDNDGDQDLAVSVLGGVMLAENQENQKFKVHKILSTSDDTQSMAAADYDQDGDIDLYVCVYRRDGKTSGEMTSLVPGEAENFVYHDANTGGPSALFRNDGKGGFTNVTDSVGMGDNNFRFSYAATWDDYDNDGDVDLYVANDFGRDNLYQNTNGSFKDIADEANIENSASGMAVISGDYDHDGWMDIFVSNMWSSAGNRVTTQEKFKADAPVRIKNRLQRLARGNTLLKNKGDATFTHKSSDANVEVGRWAWGCQFFDLNNDSWDDLMVANGFITTDDTGDL